MQVLIHKTSLHRLQVKLSKMTTVLGDAVQLVPESSDDVAVYFIGDVILDKPVAESNAF
jgi:hypothetical protein